MHLCDTPERAADYWRQHVVQHPAFSPDVETLVVLLLNTRRRVKGHALISTGTLDTLLVHPMHCHPSGDPSPSEADIKVTRDLIRAGQVLKIELLDHVIIGAGQHCSL